MISSGNQHQAQLTLIKLGRVYSCFGKWQNIVCSKACRFARLLQPGAPLVRDLFRGNCKPGPKGQRWYWEWWKGGGIHWCREFSRAHSLCAHPNHGCTCTMVKQTWNSFYFSCPHKDTLLFFPGCRLHLTSTSKHLQVFLMGFAG